LTALGPSSVVIKKNLSFLIDVSLPLIFRKCSTALLAQSSRVIPLVVLWFMDALVSITNTMNIFYAKKYRVK